MPVQLHTHDTSGVAAATLLAAVDAGVDAVDVAMDAMSGTTSQPCFGSIVEAVRNTERDTGLDPKAIRAISSYWDRVRGQYAAFESDLRGGASEVYLHEMPGGQFTNLREQARSMGLEDRWDEVARAYRDANDLLGDIVKVTPSSKVVGDLALMMVAQNLAAADVVDPDIDIAFPASVVEMLRGDLGNPPGGWPGGIQTKVLQDQPATTVRPGSLIDAADLDKERATAERLCDRAVDDRELASYLMYPRIYAEYCSAERKYGPVSALPTNVFFYGMKPGDEVSIQIELGKILLVRFQALTATDEDGEVKVFFELNGQPRTIKVPDRTFVGERTSRRKADEDNEGHVAAPMRGTISSMQVRSGDRVKAGDTLLTLEAMKMETALRAPRDGTVAEVLVKIADTVAAHDLVVVLDR